MPVFTQAARECSVSAWNSHPLNSALWVVDVNVLYHAQKLMLGKPLVPTQSQYPSGLLQPDPIERKMDFAPFQEHIG